MLALKSRTAVYGPVRTVVWQGSAGDRRPYADQGPKDEVPPGAVGALTALTGRLTRANGPAATRGAKRLLSQDFSGLCDELRACAWQRNCLFQGVQGSPSSER